MSIRDLKTNKELEGEIPVELGGGKQPTQLVVHRVRQPAAFTVAQFILAQVELAQFFGALTLQVLQRGRGSTAG